MESPLLGMDKTKLRSINPTDFLWKIFRPSTQIYPSLGLLFSSFFPWFQTLLRIKSLYWSKNRLDVTLESIETWEIFPCSFSDNTWVTRCQWAFCTDNICIWVHRTFTSKVFLTFCTYFSVKAKYLKISDLLRLLSLDPKAKREYYQIFWKSERPPFSIIQDWWHPLHKFRFFVNEWFMRNTDQSIDLNLTEIELHHSERECQGISPNNKDRGYHFFNFPAWYYDHTYDKYYYLDDVEKASILEGNKNQSTFLWFATDLDEEDIIMWKGSDKLELAINQIEQVIQVTHAKVVRFNCCCVPRVIGDDIYSILKRAETRLPIPFIFQWQLEKTPYDQKIALLETYISSLHFDTFSVRKNSISLFGYHENKFQKELVDILLPHWIRMNTSFIPTIDVRLLPLMFQSELFIISPNNFQREIMEYPFKMLWIPSITPKYPYSFQYSLDWLEVILKQFWKPFSSQSEVQLLMSRYYERVSYVKEQRFSVGIILVGKKEVEKFLNPDYTSNINVIYFLEEMGFRVEFFIYDDFYDFLSDKDDWYSLSDWNHIDIELLIQQKTKESKISFFSSETELETLLSTSNIELYYSDIYFDNRIISRWYNTFSLRSFSVWLTWALETIETFITLSQMTFYKNYSKYFLN